MSAKELLSIGIVAGIDTLEVISDESKADLSVLPFVRTKSKLRLSDNRYQYVLNPDKCNGNRTILTVSEYYQVYDTMIEKMQLNRPNLSRVDFRFDRYEGEYTDHLKLNTALLLLLAQEYKCRNRYESTDLLTGEELTIRLQNKYFEAEYYNKNQQSPNEGISSRLELRSKCLADGSDEVEELEFWFIRIEKAVTGSKYKDLLKTINQYLLLRYENEKRTDPTIKPNEFLFEHRARIFSRSQLAELYAKFGYSNPDEAAKKFITRRNVETVSYSAIEKYIRHLRIAADTFINS